jgi:hypothetical protein
MEYSATKIYMKTNYVQKLSTLNDAENNLKRVHDWLSSLTQKPVPQAICRMVFCVTEFFPITQAELENANWWRNYGYIRELEIHTDPSKQFTTVYYQVFVFSQNEGGNSMVLLQATFEKKFSLIADKPPTYPANRISWQQLR